MTDENFIHIHTHSHFSLLDGLTSPKDLAKTAKSLGFKSLALTDHGTCGGLYRFQKACKEEGIKPILGMEAYMCKDHLVRDKDEDPFHTILLAKNDVGLKNLMKLSTEAELKGKYKKPRIDFGLLEKHREGLILSTACSQGEVPQLLLEGNKNLREVTGRYKDLFGDDLYIEIMTHKYFDSSEKSIAREKLESDLAKELYQFSKDMGIKAIATNDIHYAQKSDSKYHEILLSMQTKNTIKNPNRFTFGSDDFYMKSYEEMLSMYSLTPELLKNTVEIGEKVLDSSLFKIGKDLLPEFEVPEGFSSGEQYLKKIVKDGLIEKGLIDIQEYRDRIKFEMGTIVRCGYIRYFLILWDIINWARSKGISVGPGRGSAVGCLCLYVMNVVQLDPIEHGLLFERFLNPDRISPPDVDIDFDDTRRSEVIEYVDKKYGADHCCKIGTYGSLKAKNIVRYVVKAMDLGNDWEDQVAEKQKVGDTTSKLTYKPKKSLEIGDLIAKQVPFDTKVTIESAYNDCPEFKILVDDYEGLYDNLIHMEKVLGSAGVHASGYVVCRNPITDHAPLRLSEKGQVCCQFEGPEMEEMGLLKFDFLGLKNISIMNNTVKMIKERHNVDIDLNHLNLKDQKVLSIFDGRHPVLDTTGIFQFESYGMRKLLKSIKADSFDDLVVATALFRPGPLGAGVHELYCDIKHGRKPLKPLHPKMGEVLKSTYGIMCFSGEQNIYKENSFGRIDEILSNESVANLKGHKVRFNSPNINSFCNGEKDVYEYCLSNGFSIKCTEDHMVMDGMNNYVPIDSIYKENSTVLYTVNKNFHDKKFDPKKSKICYLLGLIVGDGCIANGSSVILCLGSSNKNAEKIIEIYQSCFEDTEIALYFKTRCWYIRFSRKSNKHLWGMNKKKSELKMLLDKIGIIGNYSHKRIPLKYLDDNREYYKAFLAGYLDSDGCVGRSMYFSSANKDLLLDTAFMLWKMGYRSYLCHHHLLLSDSELFWEEVKKYSFKQPNYRLSDGSCLKIDSRYAREIINKEKGKKSVRSFCEEHNLNSPTIRRILSGKYPTCKYLSISKLAKKEEIMDHCCLLILSKKYVGKEKVYDISMPNETDHNYVVQPGIVAHNCYQESFMKVATELAGFTPGQSDTLRKVVGKKKPELIKKEQLDTKFIDGCKKNGIDEKIAVEIFKQIEYFGGYGFNKCLSGDTLVLNKVNGEKVSLESLEKLFHDYFMARDFNNFDNKVEMPKVVLDSVLNGETIQDEVIDVYETGEKELFEVQLSNGMIIKCTMAHKFYCIDGKYHELRDIFENSLEITSYKFDDDLCQKCSILSCKSIGVSKTYNVTMKSDQHNYKIVDNNGNGVYTKNSHSAAYGLVSFQCAFLKYYYTLEYMSSLLTSELGSSKAKKKNKFTGKEDDAKLDVYLKHADKIGIVVLGGNINRSGLSFNIERGISSITKKPFEYLRTPFNAIKGVGEKSVQNIIENQPYNSLKEFVSKVDLKKVNVKVFKVLLEAGCMKGEWVGSNAEILDRYEKIKKEFAKEKDRARREEEKVKREEERLSLFGGDLFGSFNADEKVVISDFPGQRKLNDSSEEFYEEFDDEEVGGNVFNFFDGLLSTSNTVKVNPSDVFDNDEIEEDGEEDGEGDELDTDGVAKDGVLSEDEENDNDDDENEEGYGETVEYEDEGD